MSIRRYVACSCLCAFVVVVFDLRVLSARSSHADSEVRQAEFARAAALAAGDVAAWDRLLADDYVEVDVQGRLHSRTEALRIDPREEKTGDVTVHAHPDVGIIVGRVDGARVMRVWVRFEQGWRLAAQQAVRIQPGAVDPEPSRELLGSARFVPVFESSRAGVRAVLHVQDKLDWANAMGDPAAFARLTDADFIVVTTHGLLRTKADRVIEERVGRLSARPQRPVPRRDDVQVRLYGRAAVITARNWPRTPDGGPRAPTRYTRVWLKNATGWQQLANISTIATQPFD